MNRERRIPTLFGLVLVLISLGGFIAVFENRDSILTRAGPSLTPHSITLSNLSDNAATLSWVTDSITTGGIVYDNDDSQLVYHDDREKLGRDVMWSTHYIMLKNLSPDKKYSYHVISGGKKFDVDENGRVLTFTTLSKLSSLPPVVEPAYGCKKDNQCLGGVVTQTSLPAEGAIVYLTIGDSLVLSTLVKSTGEWLIAISNARTSAGNAYYFIENTTLPAQETITVEAGKSLESTAITDTDHDGPVPTIVLGKTYNFLLKLPNQQSVAQRLDNGNVLGEKDTTMTNSTSLWPQKSSTAVSITVPEEKGTFTTSKPLFRGTGVPGKTVKIMVQSTPQQADVLVNASGLWSWVPPAGLPPGEHTLTIQTTDGGGNTVELTHQFIVFKSGTQVLGDATPSASLTPTITLAVTQEPTLRPSPSPTIQPTIVITSEPTVVVPTKAAAPISGNEIPTIYLLGTGAMLVLLGMIYFLHVNVW